MTPTARCVLEQAWAGAPLPVGADLRVVERGGCDVSPVDVATEDGCLTLTSYVWPDMTARHRGWPGRSGSPASSRCASSGRTPRRTSSGSALLPGT